MSATREKFGLHLHWQSNTHFQETLATNLPAVLLSASVGHVLPTEACGTQHGTLCWLNSRLLQVRELEDQLLQAQQSQQPDGGATSSYLEELEARSKTAEQSLADADNRLAALQASHDSMLQALQAEASDLRQQLGHAQAQAAAEAESARKAAGAESAAVQLQEQLATQLEEAADKQIAILQQLELGKNAEDAAAARQTDAESLEDAAQHVAELQQEGQSLVQQLQEAQARESELVQQRDDAVAQHRVVQSERDAAVEEGQSSGEALKVAEDRLASLQVSRATHFTLLMHDRGRLHACIIEFAAGVQVSKGTMCLAAAMVLAAAFGPHCPYL